MVERASHDGHVILEGPPISEASGGLKCDRDWSKGSSRVWSAPVDVASGVLNKVSGVNSTKGRGRWLIRT